MNKFRIEYTTGSVPFCSGLAVVGFLLQQTNLASRLDNAISENIKRNLGYSNGDVAKSYIGLLCLGKKDFGAIEAFRNDTFFRSSFNLERVPSSAVLEHRLDEAALSDEWNGILMEESLELIHQTNAPVSPVFIKDQAYVSVEIEGPFAFIGQEGYCIQFETATELQFIQKTVQSAQKLAAGPFLWRLDTGEDSTEIVSVLLEHEMDFILRQTPQNTDAWIENALKHGMCCIEREGENVYFGFVPENVTVNGQGRTVRKVFKMIERTIDQNGQIFLMPQYEMELYWTTLGIPAAAVLQLYNEHQKVCNQINREFKSDLHFKQLPSKHDKTNELVLHFGMFAYNLLRVIGQGNKRMKRIRDVIRELPKRSILEENEN
ncbi:hypothetical protein BpJC7_17360 [Weizmannia acidilactici]|uniref:Transposase n=1 Tax=Weizmannia acidilactici TaxID=2607726 RepID=A0A5J4JEF3_9BACI|nr:transposase [Weizmannia acidilactici]GER65556.1 hypothetical protein BpJC4_00270 [Weizmannia acidilactici]GER70433.1 hypothetical protein BpJC7_17360 [Weizmannia acidilactici]GER74096.1 hypothetical protein BpPP18_21630 [Weizmannia acidilactici]